ncbi:Bromodomain testis-specific protein [Merluccius polli]|uniref:Bromodomain testis-specific protein n=1 Tax=Merluccius polli TaxID=89951 RepID=A0AA47MAH1_MERPO|nr:Bromodomain testis-specific protein [Merluccius polli]
MSHLKLLPQNPPPPPVSHPRGPGPSSAELQYLERVVLRALCRHHFSWPFREPVDAAALNIPDYYAIISSPMDLSTIKQRLQNHYYRKTLECVQDFNTMFTNCYIYNKVHPHFTPVKEPGDDIVLMAQTLEKVFLERLAQMPHEEEQEELGSTRPPGRTKKTSSTGALKRSAPSPESEVVVRQTLTVIPGDAPLRPLAALPAHAQSANKKGVKRKLDTTVTSDPPHPTIAYGNLLPCESTATTTTMTPPPACDGLLSRREGTAKRPIKPPRKELPDWPAPMRRTRLPEPLRLCGELLKELVSRRHTAYAWPFYSPVDVDALGLHDYHLIITQPMDLGTIKVSLCLPF